MLEVVVTIIAVVALVYYVRDTISTVTRRYFELKQKIEGEEEKISETLNNFDKQIRNLFQEVSKIKHSLTKSEHEASVMWKIKQLNEKIVSLEKKIKEHEKTNTKVLYKIGNLEQQFSKIETKLSDLDETIRSSLREELLRDIREEIERLEELIERRKNKELEEFMEMITAVITIDPDTIQKGLFDVKKALLSLRDLAKIYVLTEKGVDKFNSLKENLVELLRNMRKLVVISTPDDEIYSKFNDIIVRVKRLELPVRVEKDGVQKELTPEKSFIKIHKDIYEIMNDIEEIAKIVDTPVPVTPIEKEFYEKLREQFEELRKLEEQIHQLMLRIGVKPSEEANDKLPLNKKELEDLLKELNL
ncbi:hypothetical protein [Thermococcus sp.]